MKIAVISPIQPPLLKLGEMDRREQFRLRDCQKIPAEFVLSYLQDGPKFIMNAYDDAQAVPSLIRQVMQEEKDGADAIVINCSADTGLRACREAVSIPVIGPTESTMLYASQFVDHFCILTFSPCMCPCTIAYT